MTNKLAVSPSRIHMNWGKPMQVSHPSGFKGHLNFGNGKFANYQKSFIYKSLISSDGEIEK